MGQILEMDIESFSDVDLIKCGVYAYPAGEEDRPHILPCHLRRIR